MPIVRRTELLQHFLDEMLQRNSVFFKPPPFFDVHKILIEASHFYRDLTICQQIWRNVSIGFVLN